MADADQNARLRVFALLLRYGHELFAVDDLASAAAAAINNAHELVPYETSSLFDCSHGKVRLLAQYGQPTANEHAALALEQEKAVRAWLKDPESVTDSDPTQFVRLPLPIRGTESKLDYVWLVAFRGAPPSGMKDVLKLVAASAGEAIAFHRLCRRQRGGFFRRFGKWLFWGLVAVSVGACMFVRVPDSTTSEFFVRAPQETTAYAWFDGAIATCLKKDGDRVAKDEVVARYDVSQLAYRTALAKNQLSETEAELALARQNAFSNSEELGRAKLLEIRCRGLKVSVDEAAWYIAHSEVRAPAAGVVALADGEAARLENKAVRTGDVLFRVLGGEGYEAEIPVDEREASVLRSDLNVTLFLHTAPETAIRARVLEVSHYPQLTEQKVWAYRVRVVLDPATIPGDLRYGMRGIAKLKSGEVRLGYRLFRSGVLYLRGL